MVLNLQYFEHRDLLSHHERVVALLKLHFHPVQILEGQRQQICVLPRPDGKLPFQLLFELE